MRNETSTWGLAVGLLALGFLAACASPGGAGLDVDSPPSLEFELAGGLAPGPDDVVVGPRLVRAERPAYPPSLRESRTSGSVRLRVLVTVEGRAEPDEVLAATDPLFAEAAAETIRTWRYAPATVNGNPEASWIEVVLTFGLAPTSAVQAEP